MLARSANRSNVRRPGKTLTRKETWVGSKTLQYPPTGFDKHDNKCDKQKINVASERTIGFEDTTFITI